MKKRTLKQIREERGWLQVELAEYLEYSQCHISNLEKQQDMLVSSLRRYIEEGLGGKLILVAKFRNEEYEIKL